MDINIDSQIVVQTDAEWAADATVYSAQRLLVVSDVLWTGTDQRKFKIANGANIWNDLDYPPLDTPTAWGAISGTITDQSELVTYVANQSLIRTLGS